MKKIISKCPWLLLSALTLAGCGKGGDDIKIEYEEEAVISENASNEPVIEQRAPEGFKVIYYVDSGDATPSKLEVLETFGTRSSVEEQAFGPDLVTGYNWGYTAEAAQYYAEGDKWGSIRGDERDTPGLGVEYAFELDEGNYTVVIGFDDPWDSEGTRHVDIVLDGNVVSEGYYIPAEAQYERFDDIQVTDGLLELSVQRTATNTDGSADPQISWIEIWGETDEEVANPVQKVWISGDFHVSEWELSQAIEMTPEADDWYQVSIHVQGESYFNFVDQTSTWAEYWGLDGDGNVIYTSDAGSMHIETAGYYDIRFNLTSLEYSVTPTDLSGLTAQDTMYIWGYGFPQYPELDWWADDAGDDYDITDAIPMTKNFNGMGEHVFGIQGLEFSDAIELQFVTTNDATTGVHYGFTGIDALNAAASEFYDHEIIQQDWAYIGYNNAAGTYTLIFDYALGRATLIKESTNIYMVGAGTYGDWDVSQAIEMTASEDWPGWYHVEIQFTNTDSGDEVKPYGDYKFVSTRNWDKDDYGLVDASTSDKGVVAEGESLDVMVNGGGDAIPAPAPGYYEVWFHPEDLSYVLYDIDTSDVTVRTEMYIVGKGFVDYPDLDWSPENAIAMNANFEGKGDYVFGLECLQFGDAVDIKFLGQQAWADSTSDTDLDAGFVNGGEQTAPIIWAKAHVGDGSADLKLVDQAGYYDVSFDYAINRINVVPNDSCVVPSSVWITGTFQYNDWELGQAPQMTEQGDGWFETVLHFQEAGTYSFTTTNSTWDNGWYGANDGGALALTTTWGEGETPISEAGYYTIRFNLDTLEYTATATDLSGLTAQDTMYIWGTGFPQYPNHDWWDESTSYYDIADAIPLVKNFNGMGEHVFGIADLELSDYVELQFVNSTDDSVATQWGFVGTEALNASAGDFYWHETTQSDWQYITYENVAGTYTLIFDYAAGRTTLIKQETE